MNVWRKRTGRVRDGQRETIYSKRFNGTLTLASGKRKQEPLTDDKTSSLALLNRLQREQDDKRARGITRQDEQRQRLLNGLVDDYEAYLLANGNILTTLGIGELETGLTPGRRPFFAFPPPTEAACKASGQMRGQPIDFARRRRHHAGRRGDEPACRTQDCGAPVDFCPRWPSCFTKDTR